MKFKTVSMVSILTMSSIVNAHDFAVEKQRVRKQNRGDVDVYPNEPDEDYSFEYPADVMQDTKALLRVDIPPFGPPFIPVYGESRPELGMAYRAMLYHEEQKGLFGFVRSRETDVDWYKIDLTSHNVTDLSLIFYAIPPYCKMHRYFTPAVGLVGRTNVTDANGDHIFTTDVDIPFDLPEGFGIHIKRSPSLNRHDRRNYYCSRHTNNCIFLPKGIIDGGCIEGLKDLEETNAERIEQGLEPCDDAHVVNVEIDTQDLYYAVVWDDHPRRRWKRENDYSFIWGYTEPSDGSIEEQSAYWHKVVATSSYGGHNKQTAYDCYNPYPEDGTPYPTP